MKLSRNKYYSILIHRVKEHIMLCRYYKFSFFRHNKEQLYLSLFDDRRIGYGLADRLKGMITLYALSKVKKIPYKCSFTYPFSLSRFLMPNKYNWLLNANERACHTSDVKICILQGEDNGWKRLSHIKTKKQLHVYLNRDYLEHFNNLYGENFVWGELFNELFKPSPKLEKEIEKCLGGREHFIGCHLRFMSLLGDFKEYDLPPLQPAEQEELIKKCVVTIVRLKEENDKPVFVFSDSEKFLKIVSSYPGIYSFPSKIVHIDCVSDENEDTYMKSFVDFLLLSKAEKIYSIYTDKMYPSEFPLYASKINGKPFERIVM